MTSAPFHIYSLEDKFSEKRSKNHIKKNVLIHKKAMKQDMILLTVVLFKNGHALVELGVLVILDEGGADTKSLGQVFDSWCILSYNISFSIYKVEYEILLFQG